MKATAKFIFERAQAMEEASATTGYRAHAATTGEHCISAALGQECAAKAAIGSWIVLAERDDDWEIIGVKCAKIDGEILKPDTFYILKDGEFVEAEEE